MEKDIVRKIIGRIRERNKDAFVFKKHGGAYGPSGIPDIICCYNGRFMALEVKQPGRKATEIQAHTIDSIRRAGGIAGVATDVSEADGYIDQCEKSKGGFDFDSSS